MDEDKNQKQEEKVERESLETEEDDFTEYTEQYQVLESHDEEEELINETWEEEEEEDITKVVKKRCKRRKKLKSICLDYSEDIEEESEELIPEYDDSCYEDISGGTSILSALTFQWEDKSYEFEELCDFGTIENVFDETFDYVEQDLIDEIGRKRYEYLCGIFMVPPILRFSRGLTTVEIDLGCRGIDGKNLRAMFLALETNTFVKKLVLKYNKLTKNDCFYLGRTLNVNETITILNLTGCSIGPEGIGFLVEYLTTNETLVDLNLSKCDIQDEGMIPLAYVLTRNNSIEKLDLSYNNLKEKAADALALSLKINRAITDLNLCYNKFFHPLALKEFFRALQSNPKVRNLNMAWNALSGVNVGNFIGNFLRRNRSVAILDLSDNRLSGPAIVEIKNALPRSKVKILKLGRNPMSSEDMEVLLLGARNAFNLETLNLEELWAKKSFLKALNKIEKERDINVIIGGIYSNYDIQGPDFAAVLLKRANFEATKPKSAKMRKDFGHLIWTLGEEPLPEEDFRAKVKKFKAKVSGELITQIINEFMIPKIKLIDVVGMKNKYLKLFPNSTPPPLPVGKKENEWNEVGEEQEQIDFATAVSLFAGEEENSIADEGEENIIGDEKVEEAIVEV